MNKHLRILQNIVVDQKDKLLNRIWFTLALLAIPLLLLVINTLTVTIHLVLNPLELVIFLYFLLIGLFLWGLIVIVKNWLGWLTFNKLENQLRASELNLFQISQTKTYLYFFNSWYHSVNHELSLVLQNPDFCYQQNKNSLKFQNWKFFWSALLIGLFLVGFFLSEGLYWHSFVLNDWSLILPLTLMVFYFSLILPWWITRQIVLNQKYKNYLQQKIDNYQFIFQQRYYFLKTLCEKLEV